MKRARDILISAVGLLLAWEALARFGGLPPYILPSPLRVAKAFHVHGGRLWADALVTGAETLAGFLVGAAAGIAIGLWLMASAGARRWLEPFLILSQSVPTFALAPVLTLWLGFGAASKIALAALSVYFVVAAAFYDGLKRTNREWLDAAASFGASPSQILWKARVPAAIPALGSGLKVAAAWAPIAAAVAEWAGGTAGLGRLMLYANATLKIDLMFAALLTLALMGLGFHALVGALVRRMAFWAPETTGQSPSVR